MTPRVLAGRYWLLRQLWCGAQGDVWIAEDRGGEAPVEVVVKLQELPNRQARNAHGRQAALLALAKIPGVVRYLDHGADGELGWIVMELARGTHFPGDWRAGDYAGLIARAARLLRSLQGLHGLRILHRDLSSANVLVDEHGETTILDLGLAVATGDSTLTLLDGGGTPGFIAPERHADPVGTVRSDLYSVGALLFRALTGRVPGPEGYSDVEAEYLPKGLPWPLASLLPRLLSRDPAARPASAAEAREELLGQPAYQLPYLDPRGLVATLVSRLAGITETRIVAPPGTGATRLLDEVARALDGRHVLRIEAGTGTYGSLQRLFPAVFSREDLDLEGVATAVGEALAAHLRGGGALLVDRDEQLDAHTRALLAWMFGSGRVHGSVVRVLAAGDEPHRLGILPAEVLIGLFGGPRRFDRSGAEAAEELFRRTGGLPHRVHAEVAAWLQGGIVLREGDHLQVPRGQLGRLRSGLLSGRSQGEAPPSELLGLLALVPSGLDAVTLGLVLGRRRWDVEGELHSLAAEEIVVAYTDGRFGVAAGQAGPRLFPGAQALAARLAACLPAGAPGRLVSLLFAEDGAGAGRELTALASRAMEAGASWEAYVHALEATRLAEGPDRHAAAVVLLDTAGALEAAVPFRDAARALEQAGDAQLAALSRACEEAVRGDAARALDLLRQVGPCSPVRIEAWRHAYLVYATRRLRAGASAVRDEVYAWAAATGDPQLVARAETWAGLLYYTEENYRAAAECHARAAPQRARRFERAASLVNEALCRIELREYDRARQAAGEARGDAATLGSPTLLAYAEWVLRAAAYRAGVDLPPDHLLARDVDGLEAILPGGMLLLLEASFAYRSEPPKALPLALRAWERLRHTDEKAGLWLARGLALACDAPEVPEGEAWVKEVPTASLVPEIRAQVLCLLAVRYGMRWRAVIRDLLRACQARAGGRFDILAWDEMAEMVGLASSPEAPAG